MPNIWSATNWQATPGNGAVPVVNAKQTTQLSYPVDREGTQFGFSFDPEVPKPVIYITTYQNNGFKYFPSTA